MKTRIKVYLSVVCALILIVASMPFSAMAASATPKVETIDGSPYVFVASFGKASFNGTAYAAFKSFGDAAAALGDKGGTLVLTGGVDMADYTKVTSHGPIYVLGTGDKLTGNVLQFGANITEWKLVGDITLNCCCINDKNADFVINTNGHSLEMTENYDNSYSILSHVTNARGYTNTIGIKVGNTGTNSVSLLKIAGGKYDTVSADPAGKTGSGETRMVISGGDYDKLYAGMLDSGVTYNGDINVLVTDGAFTGDIVAGSGTKSSIGGNVSVTVKGGSFGGSFIAGSTRENGTIDGNAVVAAYGLKTAPKAGIAKNGSVAGKIIYITDGEYDLADGSYDYYLRVSGGSIEPVFSGKTLKGFVFKDQNGCVSTDVTAADGTALTAQDGVYVLPEGKSSYTVRSDVTVAMNRSASFVSGYEDGTFQPQKNVSRAEAITMLVRLITDENTIKGKMHASYADVPAGAWYEPYIGLMESLGYLDTVAGEFGTKIYPDKKITRGEFVELVRNIIYVSTPTKFGEITFADVPTTYPYVHSVGEIGYLQIVGGYEDGSFRPNNEITRAEVVTIINRLISRTATGSGTPASFSDIESHWAKDQIVMAASGKDSGVWTTGKDITVGSYEILTGDNVTVTDQINELFRRSDSLTSLDFIDGIDKISKWQIDNICYSESDLSSVTGTLYYVSPNGNDDNDGKTPETAWKTLTKVNSNKNGVKKGDGILFERGGVWRGKLTTRIGCTYSAYGKGEKPRIYGSERNYADESLWKPVKNMPNVWECAKGFSADVGIMIFDTEYEIGYYNEIYGVKQVGATFKDPSCLSQDLQFFCYGTKLWLYSPVNPGVRFKTIEIGVKEGLVTATDNCVIDNLHFRYTGGHIIGTGNKKNVTAKNCIFAYAGGSILSDTTRYGNAFESYGGCDGWYAYDNWIYQIYDTGVTHQWTPTTGSNTQRNVEYAGNVIEYCHWSIEYYNRDSTNGGTRLVQDVNIHDNICRMNGYGWGSSWRPGGATTWQSADITGNTKNFVSRHNILDRSTGDLIHATSAGDQKMDMQGNIYVQNSTGGFGGMPKSVPIMGKDDTLQTIRKSDPDAILIINEDTSVIDNIKTY